MTNREIFEKYYPYFKASHIYPCEYDERYEIMDCDKKSCAECLKKWLDEEWKALQKPLEEVADQSVKSDKGKPKLSLAPIQEVWRAIAEVREYGINKYHDPDNWRKVEINRYWDALYRHIAATVNDHHSVDSESGIEHLKHALCNIAFILELEKEEKKK